MNQRNPSRSSVWGVSIVAVLFWAVAYSMDINLLLGLEALKQWLIYALTS